MAFHAPAGGVNEMTLPIEFDDVFLEPGQIADTVYYLTHQPPNELYLHPFGEKW